FGGNQRGGKNDSQIGSEGVGQAAGKAFVELGDGLQLLAPDLARAAHIPTLDFGFLRLAGVIPPATAGRPYHGIDLFLVQLVLHDICFFPVPDRVAVSLRRLPPPGPRTWSRT